MWEEVMEDISRKAQTYDLISNNGREACLAFKGVFGGLLEDGDGELNCCTCSTASSSGNAHEPLKGKNKPQ
ncbi:hypothetical protein EO98_09305 [Methanosarcina sp. 2.H.T.1A.6]|uniref:hypothetical protein n=1 Tax=unclassified Methanosarcina TaxID=2644672 RepID=UPI0006224A3A|nr:MULTISPECIES: hypothetical protein [unclassified Methanosarcina]KKG14160.1 hypothetical protein EO94_15695 [Methanosarcina sp. 2.H.T.1A.3]KKG19650.1 hypothetical protein EO98_09305 [Methanosarcina sp. 2.H.T.1A.6]KKG22153.1 hypothetical protein EO97_17460 [Methanosarcina sp. 2.H.T.1A.15]KKG26801.1 hypothetical protein EO96_02570 [Methanosarcina sp. 2.H.T.1A.8]